MTVVNAPAVTEEDNEYPKLKDQVGRVLAFAPMEMETITSEQYGDSETVKCTVVRYEESDGTLVDLGSMNVFWKKLKSQLVPFIGGLEWVVGRLLPTGRSYALKPAGDADLAAITELLKA